MILTWLIGQGIGSVLTGMGKKWFDYWLEDKRAKQDFDREKERINWRKEQTDIIKEHQTIQVSSSQVDVRSIQEASSHEKDVAFYGFLEKSHTPDDIKTRRYLAIFIMALVVFLGAYISFAFYIQSIKATTLDKTINGLLVNYSYFIMFLTVTVFGFHFGVRTSGEIASTLLPYNKQHDMVKKN